MSHAGAWHGKGSGSGRTSAVLGSWLQESRVSEALPCAAPQACPTGPRGTGSTGCSAGETDMKVHCCVAAYISDYAFLGTALLPHRQYRIKFMVSLDHSMWFHAPFRADHWMLYECESPWAGKSLVCFWETFMAKASPACPGGSGLQSDSPSLQVGAGAWCRDGCGAGTGSWLSPAHRKVSSGWNRHQTRASSS